MKMILPGVLLAAMMGYAAWGIWTLPLVYMTWPGAECVRVDSRDSEHTCQNLPLKYEIIWTGEMK